MNEADIKAILRAYAHDLRGSLSASASFAKMLNDEYAADLDERAQKWLGMMSSEYAITQKKLVSLSEYAQLIDYKVDFQACSLDKIVDTCAKQYIVSPEPARFNRIDIIKDALPQVRACHKLLSLYFSELIANSAQHAKTDKSNVTALQGFISVNLHAQHYDIVYCDNGCELLATQLNYIQEPLKVLNAKSKTTSGLGISTLKRIAELLGGSLAFTLGYEQHSGLCVSLRIPASYS